MSERSEKLTEAPLLQNRYRIRSLLGQGGMSRVYLADDMRLSIRVAVKENLQSTRESRAQFETEARILAQLAHPHIPHVFDHITRSAMGQQFLVMEYIEGQDLLEIISARGALPESLALSWILQIVDALKYLHSRQPPVIHRDIKPANIKINSGGNAILVDFGIAKAQQEGLKTLPGARGMTPGYAPPEQSSAGGITTEQSDIYSLGATLYTLLTARIPPAATRRMSEDSALLPPSQIVSVSPSIEIAILRAMELESGKRWASVREFELALQGNSAPIEIPLVPKVVQPREAKARGRLLAGAGIVAILMTILLVAFAIFSTPSPTLNSTPTVAIVAILPTETAVPTPIPIPIPINTTAPIFLVVTATPTPTRTPTATPSPTPTPRFVAMTIPETLFVTQKPDEVPNRGLNRCPDSVGYLDKGAYILISEGDLNLTYNARAVRIRLAVPASVYENSTLIAMGRVFSTLDSSPVGVFGRCASRVVPKQVELVGKHPLGMDEVIIEGWVDEKVLRQ
ncbi:MAG: serine/threonine protein kinase [Chloroflexi bacterium]|nr:serine/threonine protein kinase [Chloroflexota bacterium]MBI3739483.1 serine/threonine protein kinase [Chloroflexota bacterium]